MARNEAQGAGVRKAMANLEALPTFDAEGAVHVIVEAPRSSRVKCKYDSDLGAFVLGKPLPHGVTYPFDWGFIPSTKGEDGDPLDALVLHDAACPVGCVIACRPIAALRVSQKQRGSDVEENDRFILVPARDKTVREDMLSVA